MTTPFLEHSMSATPLLPHPYPTVRPLFLQPLSSFPVSTTSATTSTSAVGQQVPRATRCQQQQKLQQQHPCPDRQDRLPSLAEALAARAADVAQPLAAAKPELPPAESRPQLPPLTSLLAEPGRQGQHNVGGYVQHARGCQHPLLHLPIPQSLPPPHHHQARACCHHHPLHPQSPQQRQVHSPVAAMPRTVPSVIVLKPDPSPLGHQPPSVSATDLDRQHQHQQQPRHDHHHQGGHSPHRALESASSDRASVATALQQQPQQQPFSRWIDLTDSEGLGSTNGHRLFGHPATATTATTEAHHHQAVPLMETQRLRQASSPMRISTTRYDVERLAPAVPSHPSSWPPFRGAMSSKPLVREAPPNGANSDDDGLVGARGGSGGEKQCAHCGSRSTPEWRRGPTGRGTLCNACGLKYTKTLQQAKRRKESQTGSEATGGMPLELLLNGPEDRKRRTSLTSPMVWQTRVKNFFSSLTPSPPESPTTAVSSSTSSSLPSSPRKRARTSDDTTSSTPL